MLKGKNVLVTGAAGFIGSHLCEALVDQGADVRAMIHYSSRPDWANLELLPPEKKAKLTVLAGNIEDSDFVLRAVEGVDTVFHLAALIGIPYSYVAPRSYLRTNVEGTLNVLEAARRFGTRRVVHTSTSECYGTALYTPIDEQHPLQGQSPYSASKIAADKLAESYHLSFDLPVVTLRPFNTFGPRQSARAIIPTIISQALTQERIRLGSLAPERDLTFVADTAAGFIAAATAPGIEGETINLGVGKTISVGDIVARIQRLMGIDKPIEQDAARVRPEKSEVGRLLSNNAKARERMGWEPRVTLDEGLQRTIDFVRANSALFKSGQYTI